MDVVAEDERQVPPQERSRLRRWREQWERLHPHLRRPPIPPFLQRHGATLVTIVLAFSGAWIALAVAGTAQGVVGPLVVDASIEPSFDGKSIVRVNPIGALHIDSHSAPLTLDISVRAVEETGLRKIIDNPTTFASLDEEVVDDLQGVIIAAGIRGAIVAMIGATVGVALVMRSVRRALLAGAVALGAVGGSYGLAAATFDAEAARTPTYTGLITAAPGLVENAEFIAANVDAYAEQLAALVTNVSALYNTTLSLPTFAPNDDSIRVLHVADLHLSATAWSIIDSVAEQYDVDVIVDAGDIADHGTPLENSYVRPIGNLDRPYIFVKGNHDSVTTAAAVAAQPNAIVLDGEPVEVAGLRFFGAPDPRFTPDQETRGTASQDILTGTEEFAELARDLDPPADVLVYHDPSHAQLLDGVAPLVLSGHGHRRNTYVLDEGTRVMMQGSTGGAGLRGVAGEEPTPVMLSVLYFNRESKELVAWDDITLGGLGLTTAQIERHGADEETGDDEQEEDLELPTPTPTPTPNEDQAENTTEPNPDPSP
ncbi:metallophosphoesterase [Phytoactinopolyspora halotolerans]|uniref:Metallophosphoesterase n=1 Tax=Phytoactinopolyspora halotolerans TaxID=1981512 RepID=A0A6L9SFK1_9ACTN|nr:metallophosphoesterase [Phytoactinopolyspora halotolerans]NEE03853.1 metallophosphoesterase [Phytoactinopolyspora halotolerans]